MAPLLTGIGVSPGVATGQVARMAAPPVVPADSGPITDVEAEVVSVTAALEAAATDLDERAARASGAAAAVLCAQAMMARDPSLLSKALDKVRLGRSGRYAVAEAFEEFRVALAAAGPYLAERVADLDDVRNRAIAHLLGVPMPGVPEPGHPFILVARDLSPADTATLDTTQVLAIVTEQGGPTSHTAILAKSLGVPAVVACAGAESLADFDTVLVDGGAGTVVAAPDPSVVKAALGRQAARRAAMADSQGPGRTSDGHAVQLLVNLGGERELAGAAAVEAEGVGLFRTEFLFLDRPDAPSLEEQQGAYRNVFEAFADRKVVVRTLDAGADKPLRFVTQPDEPNPALGVRGLRTARRLPELLDQQLEAIALAEASTAAQVWVMAPMVSTPSEASSFALQAHAHGLPVAGVMIEVPAAALRARSVAAVCDFLSLGTNDLAQYAFAADRTAGELADLLDPWQPALLDLVRLTSEAANDLGKPVGVCGEAASDPWLALVLVGLGITSLSMAPNSLAEVRTALAAHSIDTCRLLAQAALEAPDARSARAAVHEAASI